jgi:hypothetical protein
MNKNDRKSIDLLHGKLKPTPMANMRDASRDLYVPISHMLKYANTFCTALGRRTPL